MEVEQSYGSGKIKVSFIKKIKILAPYVRSKFMEQVKSVWFIIFYLVAFQIVVLRLPIVYSLMISVGVFIVILGLMFFMEGLTLGLMPFGEVIGALLPKKSKLPVILGFSFLLGLGATFAEPAIAVLKMAGKGVIQSEAPLLYSILNEYTGQLVACVGTGVGIAVLLGVLRFLYGWSLKPIIIPVVLVLIGLTIWAHFNDILNPIIGLAWDCGAVTTGPITVPLVLALGIGVCRIVGTGDSGSAGFGIVTLASLFPILAVMGLGIYHYKTDDVYSTQPEKKMVSSIEKKVEVPQKVSLKGFSKQEFESFHQTGKLPAHYMVSYEGGTKILQDGKILLDDVTVVYTKIQKGSVDKKDMRYWNPNQALRSLVRAKIFEALRAIVPLCLFLFLTLWLILRAKVPNPDEIILGIVFCILGMSLFGLGIHLGLSPLGQQLGSNIPSSFTAITPWGLSGYQGPLYGQGFWAKMVAVVFAFFLGYGATLAEPALNALGATVEKITIGAFKKSLLMQTVAIGVAIGIGLGVLKIVYNIPLTYLLIPPYLVLMVLTWISTEEFVNFGWDSAGVTTGPITVPLVLAMGLGVGGTIPGVSDGFGVLALASAAPIISVLTVGLIVGRTGNHGMDSEKPEGEINAGV